MRGLVRRPQNGSQAHELSRKLELGRTAQLGATPFWDRRRNVFEAQPKTKV